jgi:chromosome segregation ATPase
LRGSFNLKQLQHDRDMHRGQFEFLESTKVFYFYLKKIFLNFRNLETFISKKNELEDLQQEEQELMCKLAVIEKAKNDANKLFEEKHKFLKNEKKEVQSVHEKLAAAEKELSVKDLEYDRQLASQTNGNHIENLPVKHQQKVGELENLQSTFIDLENKIDELHSKQIQKTTDVCSINIFYNETYLSFEFGSNLNID